MEKKVKELNITYLGIKNPKTPEEINFEILGLETLIAEANSKIAQLKQAVALASIVQKEKEKNNDNYIS